MHTTHFEYNHILLIRAEETTELHRPLLNSKFIHRLLHCKTQIFVNRVQFAFPKVASLRSFVESTASESSFRSSFLIQDGTSSENNNYETESGCLNSIVKTVKKRGCQIRVCPCTSHHRLIQLDSVRTVSRTERDRHRCALWVCSQGGSLQGLPSFFLF